MKMIKPLPLADSNEADLFTEILEVSERDLLTSLKLTAKLDIVLSLIEAPREVAEKILNMLSPRAQEILRGDVSNVANFGRWETAGGIKEVDNSPGAQAQAQARFLALLIGNQERQSS